MTTFRSKPRTIQAIRIGVLKLPDVVMPVWVFKAALKGALQLTDKGSVALGGKSCEDTDWLVKEARGCVSVISASEFEKHWDPLPDAAPEELTSD